MTAPQAGQAGLSRAGAIAMALAFVWLVAELPSRYQASPNWLIYGDMAFFVAAIAAGTFWPARSTWQRAWRLAALAAMGIAFAGNSLTLVQIVNGLMTHPQTLKPLSLFHTSVALWFANILIFTITYWLLDGGGPEARLHGTTAYFDFDFPARSDPSKLGPDWQPTIIDYLFIAFTANTSFGPTEAMPLTARAKTLLILQSFVSLVTIGGVAARAIGATGG